MTQQTRLRLKKIMEIVEKHEVGSQEEIADLLAREGVMASQTTISRDIRRLRLEKKTRSDGKRVYEIADEWLTSEKQALMRLFREAVRSVDVSMNLIVLKTMSGSAGAVAEVIDSYPNRKILGTLAGDNTVFVAVVSPEACEEVAASFRDMM